VLKLLLDMADDEIVVSMSAALIGDAFDAENC
jgi:hypothetical protein